MLELMDTEDLNYWLAWFNVFGSPLDRSDWNAAIIAATAHNAGFGTKSAKEPKEFLLRFETEKNGADEDLEFAELKLFAAQQNARTN